MLFLPLIKADQENRLVYARAAAEEIDRTREIMDYASGKPQFEAWSAKFRDATLGKSLGNIRAMHNPQHLAGVVKGITYDDGAKAVDVCFKVLDPVDWHKIEEGGYTGLSIGGGYLKKWTDPGDKTVTRYTPRIAEISLVDSPCIPSARIMELQKQDGTTEEVLLKGSPRSFAELRPPPSFNELRKALRPPIGLILANQNQPSPVTDYANRRLKQEKVKMRRAVGQLFGKAELTFAELHKAKAKPKYTRASAIGTGIGAAAGLGAAIPIVVAGARHAGGVGSGVLAGSMVGAGAGIGHRLGHRLRPNSKKIGSKRHDELVANSFKAAALPAVAAGGYGSIRMIRRHLSGVHPAAQAMYRRNRREAFFSGLKDRARQGASDAYRAFREAHARARGRTYAEPVRGAARFAESKFGPAVRFAARNAPRASLFLKQEAIIANLEKANFGRAGQFASMAGRGIQRGYAGLQAAIPHAKTAKELIGLAGGVSGIAAGVHALRGRGRRKRQPGEVQQQSIQPAGTPPTPSMLRQAPTGEMAKASMSPAEREKVHTVLHEFKHKKLRSWRGVNPGTGKPRRGPKVTDRKQAIAIALNQARRLGKGDDALEQLAGPERKQLAGTPMEKGVLGAMVGGYLGSKVGRAVAGGMVARGITRRIFTGKPVAMHELQGHTIHRAGRIGSIVGGAAGTAAGLAAGSGIRRTRKDRPKVAKSDALTLVGNLEALDKARFA